MTQNLSKTDVDRANFFAEMECSELNIKILHVDPGIVADGKRLTLIYEHDTVNDRMRLPLDVYLDGVAQNKPDLAAFLFSEWHLNRTLNKETV